ncbi:dihydrofolate reductase family protein [Streptomyces sp. NPDC058295]|uniref:dihydrofolate reductase family protein n=1 Tax=Streptomyces sp. NPDC058295 TaxID=3346431 RepID=UPI0036E29880
MQALPGRRPGVRRPLRPVPQTNRPPDSRSCAPRRGQPLRAHLDRARDAPQPQLCRWILTGYPIVPTSKRSGEERSSSLARRARYDRVTSSVPATAAEAVGAPVNDGIEHAVDRAREAAGDRDVRIAGGGATILEHLNAGLVDEFSITLAPVLLGAGTRLFEGVDASRIAPEPVRSEPSSRVTHLTYAVHPR